MKKLPTRTAEQLARDRFEATKNVPKLEKVDIPNKTPLVANVSWLEAILGDYYWTLLSRIGLATEGKLVDTDKGTTLAGTIKVILGVIAAAASGIFGLDVPEEVQGWVVSLGVSGYLFFSWLQAKLTNKS